MRICILIVGVVILFSNIGQSDTAKDEAMAIVDKAIKAHGGAEKLMDPKPQS